MEMSIFHSNHNQQKIISWLTQALSIILGFFDYYARAIDNTMQMAVITIASSLLNISWKDLKFWINTFIDYVSTQPDAKIWYHESQMNLWIHSDASYLSESISHSSNGVLF